MFNQAENYFPALEKWRPPRIPRPKILDGRRERTWSENEIKVVLGELFAPKRENENVRSAIARYKVGRKVQFTKVLPDSPRGLCKRRNSLRSGQEKRSTNPHETARRARDGLVRHEDRHTATTHLLESNVSSKSVQEWMGWSDKAFVLYYSHATRRSREEAGQSLERLAGGKTA